jgi:predicted ATPase
MSGCGAATLLFPSEGRTTLQPTWGGHGPARDRQTLTHRRLSLHAAPPPNAGQSLPAGTMLRDYRIERVLGEGGFGIVYLAEDAALGRRVAIKEYLPTAMAVRAPDGRSVVTKGPKVSETFALGLRSFVNEARLLVRFDHPALVKVHQFWEEAGTAYMVMPFYEGPTLGQQMLSLRRPLTEAELLEWLMPLLDALAVLHADKVYHRDIAPDNILLTATGPLLLDFGAARRVIGDLTQALTVLLKPGYAPIEQYGESPDMEQGPWTDIFALASVVYMVTSASRPPSSVERVFNDRRVPLTQLVAGRYAPALLAAVDRAMAVRPEHRPQSVDEFRRELCGQAAPPPASLVREVPHNLPLQRTSFIGRERETREIRAALASSPLVTVLGMGGLGKTRLALRVAAELLPQFADGAWFVDLSAVTDPARVVGAVARSFDLRDEPGRPLLEVLCAWLRPRHVLIVLDNCEHLIEAAAQLADAILGSAAQVRLLASSREPLDVPGEQCYPVAPLPLPPREAGLQTLLQSPAVQLFGDRARSQQPDFVLEQQDAEVLAELIGRLEGIPLAIELAAARLRTLSVPEVLAGLADRYEVLTGGSRVLQKRQQTLRALVDWSYDLLDPSERALFARLAVFAGGFDGEAVNAICTDMSVPADEVADRMRSLVQKSLVAQGAEGRFRMLDTLRDYAREKLAVRDVTSITAARHAAHYFALAKEAGRGMRGADQGHWTRRLEVELDNLRAAGACALAGGVDPLIAVKLAVALTNFWILRGQPSEGRQLVAAALKLPEVQQSELAQAWALFTSATLAGAQGDHVSAIEQFETCLALRRRLERPIEIAATLSALALARLQAGDPAAATAAEQEALRLFIAQGDLLGCCIGWLHLAQIDVWTGRGMRALGHVSSALDLAREIGNPEVEAESELTAAGAHALLGRVDVAQEVAQRALRLSQDASDTRGEASARGLLGRLALEVGDVASARVLLLQALADCQVQEMRPQLMAALDDMVQVRGREGAPIGALELAGATDQARLHLLLQRSPGDEARWQEQLRAIRQQVPVQAADDALRRGRGWSLEQALMAAREVAPE